MIIAAVACFIAGMLLGTRFRVAILLPIMLVTVAAIFSFGLLSGQEASLMIAWQIMALTALQLGYLSAATMAARSARKLYQRDGMTVHVTR
jgi:Flp pilus assembly protein TadG